MSQEDQAAIAAEKARADAAETKLAAYEKAQADKERAASHTANTDFAESLVTAGTLKPADKALVVQALDFAEYPAEQSVDFGEGTTKKPLAAALRDLGQREVNELHVEAGYKLNGSLLREGLVDELLLYQAPTLLGEGQGIAALGPFGALSEGISLELKEATRIGADLRLIARVAGRDAF